jgi:ribosomal protein L15
MKVVRTYHIEEELDRRMDEAVFKSNKELSKTKIVNDAVRAYLKVLADGKTNTMPTKRSK